MILDTKKNYVVELGQGTANLSRLRVLYDDTIEPKNFTNIADVIIECVKSAEDPNAALYAFIEKLGDQKVRRSEEIINDLLPDAMIADGSDLTDRKHTYNNKNYSFSIADILHNTNCPEEMVLIALAYFFKYESEFDWIQSKMMSALRAQSSGKYNCPADNGGPSYNEQLLAFINERAPKLVSEIEEKPQVKAEIKTVTVKNNGQQISEADGIVTAIAAHLRNKNPNLDKYMKVEEAVKAYILLPKD